MEINKNRTKNILRNICISTLILFIGIIMIVKSFKVEEGTQNLLYSYNINKSVNYTVKLKENNFFTTNELEMDTTYISNLVDKINMDFSYSFSGNKKAKTKYIYQIVGITNVRYDSNESETESNNNVIWSKQHVILEPKEVEIEQANFNVKENVDINFSEYNEEVKNFKQEMKMPVNADLQIKMIVRSDSDVPGVDKKVTEISIMNLKMDLNQDVFTIEKDFKNADSKSIIESTETTKNVNKPVFVVGCLFVVIAIMIVLASVKKYIKFSKKTDYDIALNRILKNYGDIVAEVVSPVEIDNLNVIDVKNFDQLLDIEEEIRMPILFYETIEQEQGEFVIVCDTVAYRYVIGN